MAPLVSTELLAGMLGQPGLAVLDATYYLPDEGKDGRALFNAAHIPGAGFFDVDEIADQTSGLPHMLPSPAAFSAAAGGLGVGTGAPVIVYDQRGIFSAARVWWMFRVFGHDNVAVLDGGLPKWQAEGRAVTDAISAPAPQTFDATFRPEKVRTLAQMRDNLASGEAVMLDARSAGRFSGTVPEPRAGMKSGHIPGSKSLPFATLLEAGAMLPPARLREIFAAAGVDGTRPVITSCGSGVTAAVLTLGMVLAGLPEGALYDGSWSEWGALADTPVEV